MHLASLCGQALHLVSAPPLLLTRVCSVWIRTLSHGMSVIVTLASVSLPAERHSTIWEVMEMLSPELLAVQVNGEAIETAQRQLSATYGPVTAADCLLSLPSNSDLECGAFQKLIVQPRNLQHGEPHTAIQQEAFI